MPSNAEGREFESPRARHLSLLNHALEVLNGNLVVQDDCGQSLLDDLGDCGVDS